MVATSKGWKPPVDSIHPKEVRRTNVMRQHDGLGTRNAQVMNPEDFPQLVSLVYARALGIDRAEQYELSGLKARSNLDSTGRISFGLPWPTRRYGCRRCRGSSRRLSANSGFRLLPAVRHCCLVRVKSLEESSKVESRRPLEPPSSVRRFIH